MHKPDRGIVDEKEILVGFLDYDRGVVERKLRGLSEADARASVVPSGWSMLELAWHLASMERRWLRWGFLAEPLGDPYPDSDETGSWHVDASATTESVLAGLRTVGETTARIVAAHDLDERSSLGGRFSADDEHAPPTLRWVLVYVIQEYSRHLGHLDIARELIDGETGE
ncbi:DinB family protein [Humibacter ginsenosidimutans]|uniref:DinB family protein n=1 Tax=Humibacter ginsenosidimutans TaxID=2599293 RepID=UPI001FEE69AC|nr:DinB family protein [Humibacter ginsenosidimutans]